MSRRENDPEFSARIVALRKRLGYDVVADFIRALGVTYNTYGRWENDNSAPSMTTLARAIHKLGVSEWGRLTLWLAVGPELVAPPAWLDDKSLDPYSKAPPPPGGPGEGRVLEFPNELADARAVPVAAMNAFKILEARKTLSPEKAELRETLVDQAAEELGKLAAFSSATLPRTSCEAESRIAA